MGEIKKAIHVIAFFLSSPGRAGNHERPNMGLGGITPKQKLAQNLHPWLWMSGLMLVK
jgi:hypothetical protein